MKNGIELHADVQEYVAPFGDVAPDVWEQFDAYVRDRLSSWPEALSKDINEYREGWRYCIEHLRETIGDEYMRPSSKQENYYVGTLAKRVAKYFRRICKVSIPATDLAEIGNIAARHTSRQTSYYLDFTNSFDWNAGEFGDPNSCFWGSKSGAKEMLSENGAYAVRVWKPSVGGYYGVGRAWIAPHAGLWFLFNAYGPLAQLPLARLIATRYGLSYIRVAKFVNNRSTEGTLWINDGATAIGDAAKIAALGDPVGRIDLRWDDVSSCICEACECELSEDDRYSSPDGTTLCESCWCDQYSNCAHCGETVENDSIRECDGNYYCETCADSEGYVICAACDHYCNDCIDTEDGDICSDCLDEYQTCAECETVRRFVNMTEFGDEWYCNITYHRCINDVSTMCAECGERTAHDDIAIIDNRAHCLDCVPETVETATREESC